jgi:hypothetical protein
MQSPYYCESVTSLTEKRSGVYCHLCSFIHIGNVEACYMGKIQFNFTRFLFKLKGLPLINYFLFQLKNKFYIEIESYFSYNAKPYIIFSGNERFVAACIYSHIIQNACYNETKLHQFVVVSSTLCASS